MTYHGYNMRGLGDGRVQVFHHEHGYLGTADSASQAKEFADWFTEKTQEGMT